MVTRTGIVKGEHCSQCCFAWVGDTNDDNDLVNSHSHQATRPLSSVLFLPGWSEGNVVGEGVGGCRGGQCDAGPSSQPSCVWLVNF